MGTSQWIDMVLLVVFLMLQVYLLGMFFGTTDGTMVSYTTEKTAVDTDSSLYVKEIEHTGIELLMTLALVDDMIPFPRSININDTDTPIDLNSAWIADKSSGIATVYSSPKYNLKEKLDWVVTDLHYENNGSDPYWSYTLEAR